MQIHSNGEKEQYDSEVVVVGTFLLFLFTMTLLVRTVHSQDKGEDDDDDDDDHDEKLRLHVFASGITVQREKLSGDLWAE